MTETSAITVLDNPEAQRFEAVVEGHLAVAEYRMVEGGIMFTHTEVPPALEGRGVGGALARAGLKAARERKLRVLPTCKFFAAYIQRHAEEQDLLDPRYRTILGLD